MSVAHTTDLNLSQKDVSGLTSADALAGFLAALGYDTSRRQSLTPESIGLAGDSAAAVKRIELLSEDAEGLLRVTFVQLRSLTAKSRNDLARVLGRTNVDHLLILTSDFEVLEFVLLDKQRRAARGPVGNQRIAVVPLSIAISRKGADSRQLRTLRRLTWTARDGLDQFDKLRSVFEAAAFSEDYFCNRALFADHYLLSRLREDAAWRDNPSEPFRQSKQLLADARHRWQGKDAAILRNELYEPIFALLGFDSRLNEAAAESQSKPDYFLAGAGGKTAAFVYPWDRWLDGPDFNLDPHSPEENPGACVVTALDEGVADWIIVTNGRQWRLYSRNAHSRATNFYETDLVEALIASGDTDPNEAFRYWWLFFRAQAFAPPAEREHGCWLDAVAEGSREYAKQLGERLKQRIFIEIFPHLAKGFLEDRRRRIGSEQPISDAELEDTYEATLTLLYRLLFLLYAESRDLLPVREAPYRAASLTKIKQEIAERGGIAESESADRLAKAFSTTDTAIYDRLLRLCAAMDSGDPALNVPVYNGGLFLTRPSDADTREARIARFLAEHKVPDRFLALAIDRVARDPDDKTFALVFIDYKSLEVRHLGSIYEGLLEFKLRVADEDLAARTEKGREKLIPLSAARAKRGRAAEVAVAKGDVYLSNDKSERKASGSYYTPDPIVKYIVENTVGPVLSEKLESFRSDLRKVRKTYDNELAKLRVPPIPREVSSGLQTPEQFAGEKTYLAHRALVDAMFDFRTLDPAMGSGHFLVEAVDFITDRLLTFLSQFPRNPVSFMLERTRRNILEALGEQGIAVDPDKLTEINLLKRHVLKRCIYGVDLNPMAVELAKVSLWLDAFTIGAPLSFLDHHLRCGNSLIGATFKDLEAATKGQLFSIDYEPLLRAIRHVIQINAMADATAAEVKQSASEYTIARRELSGYQIVLDLLVARHFGFPNAAKLLSHYGKQLDLASRGSFMASLEGLEESATAEKVETLATQPDRRFFHWEIEFPEVFFAFADANQRQLKHKNELAAGSAGFDAVVGNPPYVRIQTLGKPVAAFIAGHFEAAAGKFDLYVAFIERAWQLLCNRGLTGLIVPNKLLTADYGTEFRRIATSRQFLRQIVDFGSDLVFSGANTYCCLLFMGSSPSDNVVMATGSLHEPIATEPRGIATSNLDEKPWSTRPSLSIAFPGAMPLRSVCRAIFQGLITGADPLLIGVRSDSVLILNGEQINFEPGIQVPLLKGPDVKRFSIEFSNHFVIYPYEPCQGRTELMPEEKIAETYPATYGYLRRRKDELLNRGSASMVYPAWYAHWCPRTLDRFKAPKIVTQVLARRASFAIDLSGKFAFVGGGNAGVYGILPSYSDSDRLWLLLAILNSDVFDAQVKTRSSRFRGDYFSYARRFIENVAIPNLASLDVSSDDVAELIELTKRRCGESRAADDTDYEAKSETIVNALYGSSIESFA